MAVYRILTPRKVYQRLLENDGRFTARIGIGDFAWNPYDPWDQIMGPVDEVTYILRSDHRVELIVNRGNHRLVLAPDYLHVVSKQPIPEYDIIDRRERKGRRIAGAIFTLWLTLLLVGAAVGGLTKPAADPAVSVLMGMLVSSIAWMVLTVCVITTFGVRSLKTKHRNSGDEYR